MSACDACQGAKWFSCVPLAITPTGSWAGSVSSHDLDVTDGARGHIIVLQPTVPQRWFLDYCSFFLTNLMVATALSTPGTLTSFLLGRACRSGHSWT